MSQSQQSSSQQSHGSNPSEMRPRQAPCISDAPLKITSKTRQIVINLSMTHYDVITDVAEELQWKIQYSSKKGDWDVLWIDSMVEPETLMRMHFFQKISHFPGIYVLARKNLLGQQFNQMAKKFPNDYNFFPKTWLLPAQFPQFRQEVQQKQKLEKNQCYIVKPQADCQGRGIFLTFKTDQVKNGRHYVIQQYLPEPFLVDGLKFDFRVYVLLCGTNPMRLYVYEQGLARFATEKYQYPNKSNLKNMCMHLTNYAINKKNPKYVYNTSVHNMSTGHKRTLSSVYKYIQKKGLNIQSFKNKLYDMLNKTLLMGQPLIGHQYRFAQPDDQYHNMCFHILGIDVMIDELLNPYVIQVNHTPSFVTDTPLDYYVKFNLIKDTLNLMNINEVSKKKLVKKTNNYQRERITDVKKLVETEEYKQKVKQAQKQRDVYESQHLGKYVKIFPFEGQGAQQKMDKYDQFLKYAEKIYFSQNNVIRMHIENQREKVERDKPLKIEKVAQSNRQNTKQKLKILNTVESSRKIEKKLSSVQSPNKMTNQILHKNRSQSSNQKDKTPKNSEVTDREKRVSSLLQQPFGSFSSNYSNRLGNINSPGFIKIAKSISDAESQQFFTGSRGQNSKNLPKIDQKGQKATQIFSPIKGNNSNSDNNKSKYVSFRKKKIESKDQKIRDSLKQIILPSSKEYPNNPGTFLVQKMIKFIPQQEGFQVNRQQKSQQSSDGDDGY